MSECLKSEAQALVVLDGSRECFVEVYIDNRCKIVIVYIKMFFFS